MKLLPHDRDAERLLLQEILLAADSDTGAGRKRALRARVLVGPEDFYDGKHRAIFEAICALVDAGKEPEIVAVWHWLVDHGRNEIRPADLGLVIQ